MSSVPLKARYPLTRRGPGEYESPDGSVRVVCVKKHTWLVVANGEPVSVLGVREHTTLREARGALADRLEVARGARVNHGRDT